MSDKALTLWMHRLAEEIKGLSGRVVDAEHEILLLLDRVHDLEGGDDDD